MKKHSLLSAALFIPLVALPMAAVLPSTSTPSIYEETFDTHWQRLKDEYPYFDLYQVDWDAERAEHRPRAVAAENDDEFAWELARLISALPDPHVSFLPSMNTVKGRWSMPEIETKIVQRQAVVVDWKSSPPEDLPEAFRDDPLAYPEIIQIRGQKFGTATEILVGGPLGTSFEFSLRWPDGSETVHQLKRPDKANLPPPQEHHGEGWLVSGKVGEIGYIHIKTFDPKRATLGPDGKMTTMLRAALKELADTESLILDFQGNGGGLVSASDPFLGHFLKRSQSYRWGNAGGKRRVIRPRSPRYSGKIVALVDGGSASGGEWAPRILRDAERAVVVGGRTAGAEAAVHTSTGADGSVVRFSAWPMAEPGVKPFQEVGIEVDHPLPLTLGMVREHGYEEASDLVRRTRMSKALELLDAPVENLDAFMELADQ